MDKFQKANSPVGPLGSMFSYSVPSDLPTPPFGNSSIISPVFLLLQNGAWRYQIPSSLRQPVPSPHQSRSSFFLYQYHFSTIGLLFYPKDKGRTFLRLSLNFFRTAQCYIEKDSNLQLFFEHLLPPQSVLSSTAIRRSPITCFFLLRLRISTFHASALLTQKYLADQRPFCNLLKENE
jgi:hypothetical protein